tara:strand:+ start:174 stop:398 length:225 start_codon:yes stop_codon:yes gene_type:complete
MKDLISALQDRNPYVLTALEDGTPVFMNKHNPMYKAKKNDRIVSLDCVIANESRLVEITEEFGLLPQDGVFELQ